MASRDGETLVARQQRSVERFGKGDVDGIIGVRLFRKSQTRGKRKSCGYRRKGKSARSAIAARLRSPSISPFADAVAPHYTREAKWLRTAACGLRR